MAHVVSGLMRKAPFIKQGCGPTGESTLYAIELSELIKDYKTGEKSYTNYKAMFFAKTQAANDYYSRAFAEGSFVVVACEKLKVEVSDCGQYIKMFMDNPRLESSYIPEGQAAPTQQAPQQRPAQQQAPQQGGYQQQAPAQNGQYDPDIPFMRYAMQKHSHHII